MPKQPKNPKVPSPYYMTQAGKEIVYYEFNRDKMAYDVIGRTQFSGDKATKIYEAAVTRKLRFYIR